MSNGDGYSRFNAALSDPAAAVALLLERDSNKVSVMIDVMGKHGDSSAIVSALVEAIPTNPRAAAYAVLELARRKVPLPTTEVIAALRPHLEAESRAAFALLQLGVAEPSVIARIERTLEDFDDLCTTMASLRWSVKAGVDPRPVAHIAIAALARDPGSGGSASTIQVFAEAGADMSAAIPELERRAAGDEDDDDYDYDAADALSAIRAAGTARSAQ